MVFVQPLPAISTALLETWTFNFYLLHVKTTEPNNRFVNICDKV